jgi:hypothetical protein
MAVVLGGSHWYTKSKASLAARAAKRAGKLASGSIGTDSITIRSDLISAKRLSCLVSE